MSAATTEPAPSTGKSEVTNPEELTLRLEQVGGKLMELTKTPAGCRIADPIRECVQELRVVWSALRQFSLVFDANRIETMQERESELRQAMQILNGTVASLSAAHEKTASTMDSQLGELDQLESVGDASLLVGRLRTVTGSVREAAVEMKDEVQRSARGLDASEQIIQAVDKKLAEASHQVLCDGLTRVLNRVGFEQRLDEIVAQSAAVRSSWCVALLTIDHLEMLNKKFGRRVGDALLFRIAGIIQSTSESYPGAIVGRTGGKDFGVILPRCPLREGRRMAQELRGAISLAKWECKTRNTPTVIAATVSVGVTEFRQGENVASLLERAESCCRQAIRQGGNTAIAEG